MGFLREYRGPLIGAAGLHAGLLLIAALASLQWVREQPPVQLAIEATVVDSSALPQAANATRPAAKPTAKPANDPGVQARSRAEAERRAADERAAQQAERDTRALREREAADRQQREQAELQRQAEATARDKAAADAQASKSAAEAKAKATAEARKRELAAAEQQRREELLAREQAERSQAEREAALRRQLAAEEEEAASGAAQPGIIDEYRAALVQAVERNWIKPVTARQGLECVLLVDQAQGGTVLGVRIGRCNGDEATRESIVTAVHRASPLPLPKDPRAFQRRLEIVFKPTE